MLATASRVVTDISILPDYETALVFGTSPYQKGGGKNPFFEYRMNAAYDLISSNKVEALLLSGSKDSTYYNEPLAMKEVLSEKGVPDQKILIDEYGNRTLESLIRFKSDYPEQPCILVTQKFHAYRALYIAECLGIDAVCYEAESPNLRTHFPAIIRELFARPKALIDLHRLTILSPN